MPIIEAEAQVNFKAPDRYFTPAEVELHNAESDLWLSWLGHVYDLTSLSQEYKGKNIYYKFQGDILMVPILKHAGQDISNWFDPKTASVVLNYLFYRSRLKSIP